MIQAKITEVRTETITDFLGPDGAQRQGDYPCVLVQYFDPDNLAAEYGVASYPIRPGSAIQSMDDVTQAIKDNIATLMATQVNPPTPVEPVVGQADVSVSDLQSHVDTVITAQ